ncbi:MAG: peptidase T [Phascolarctobacterium sp.]|nr:peptidase T [Phascolarctobacterium sp.]
MNLQAKLLERFLRYVAVTSQSNAAVKTVPTTSGQRELAELLKTELAELGLVDLEISEFSVLTGKLPANLPAGHHAVPAVGWVAHLDTVDVCLNADIHPQVVKNYQGGDICLNEEKQIFLKVSEHLEIEKYIGEDIVVSDGTSVLGADDKAAIANVMVALETLANDKTIYHGDIYVCFVPDEEIGLLGAKKIDFEKFPVDFAYTIDCCELGEVVYETFNAGSAEVYIKGITAHPMSAKGVLVNPTLVATDLVNSFDRMQTPEHTEGTEGYIWVTAINSNVSEARVNMAIRDHSKVLYEARKEQIKNAVEFLKLRHPKAVIELTMSDTYGNIADAIREDNKKCIDFIYQAMEELEITPKTIAMRGGTDGSFISTKGILTPNYFTGAHNFHSNCEFWPLGAAEKSCRMTLKLIELITK